MTQEQVGTAILEQRKKSLFFDSDRLPWSRHLSLWWICLLVCASGNLLALPLGIYLGLWLRERHRSAVALVIFAAIGCCVLALCLEEPGRLADFTISAMVALWFLGAFLLRHEVMAVYQEAEGRKFDLSIPYTALFSVWYINYRLRPEWPH